MTLSPNSPEVKGRENFCANTPSILPAKQGKHSAATEFFKSAAGAQEELAGTMKGLKFSIQKARKAATEVQFKPKPAGY